MTSTKKTRISRVLARTAVGLLVILALLTAGASVAIHRILVTGKLKQWVNGHPEKMRVEYSSAEGWFPWDIRVKDLEIRARDPNVEWYVRMDEVETAFAPLALAGRRLVFTRAKGRGLVFRLRVRVDPKEAAAAGAKEHFDALPDIPGFPPRPIANPKEDAEERAASGKPLKISLTGLDVSDVREIWIDIWRLSQPKTGRLVGSFDLRPRERASVGPTQVELTEAKFSIGRQAIAGAVSFAANGRIRAFDPRQVKGNDVWPYISCHVKLNGRLAGLDFLNHFLRTSKEPRLAGGTGALAAQIEFEDGKGHGTVDTAVSKATARYSEGTITSDVDVKLRVPAWDLQHGRLDLAGTTVSLEHASAGAPGPDSRDWWGRFLFSPADMKDGRPEPFHALVTATCRDARPLFTLFQVGLPGWARGVLKLEGLQARARFGLGDDRLDVDGLDAAGGPFRIQGDSRARGSEKNGAFLLESKLLALGIQIEGAHTGVKLAGAKEWFANRAKPDGRVAAR